MRDTLGIMGGTYPRTPLSGREYAALQTLFALRTAMEVTAPTLAERAKTAEVQDEMNALAELSDTVTRRILQTVPLKKLAGVMQNLSHVRIYIKVEAPGIPTMSDTNWLYVPAESLDYVLNEVMDTHCMMCDKTEIEGRKCPLRRHMEACLPHVVKVARGSDKCKYADLSIGLDDVMEV